MRNLLTFVLVACLVACATSTVSAAVLIGGALNNGYLDDAVRVQNTTGANPASFLPQPAVWTYEGTTTIFGPFVDGVTVEPQSGQLPTPQTTGALGDPPRPDGCSNDPLVADCGAFFKAFQGSTARGPITVHLFQDHPATPGLKYILTGWAGGQANHLAAGHELAIEFLDAGGNLIPLSGDINPLAELLVDNGQPRFFKEYMAMAVAPANAAEVRARVSMIGGMANPLGGGQAFDVDDIVLTAIPEPASLALGLIGVLGLVGLVRRR